MSLRSLLPLGRAFEPSVERAGRFRPADPGLLPDFTRESRGLPEERPEGVAGEVRAKLKSESEPERRADGDAGVRRFGALEAEKVGGRVRGRGVGRRLPRWLEQLILVLIRPGNRRRSSRPVQSEFCLRSVTVAKNDLVTSDVEVVVRKPAKPAAMSASCRARLLALWWSPVARRLGRWGNRSQAS